MGRERAFKRRAQQARVELFSLRRQDMRRKMTQVHQEMKSQYASANSLDLVIVMDCTSSMAAWINQAKTSMIHTIDTVKTAHAKAKVRVGFVAYRDFSDGPKRVEVHPLTEDVVKVKNFIGQMLAFGGGDTPEDVPGGLEAALALDMTASAKRVILVTDAPCHGKEYHGPSLFSDSATFAREIAASPCIRRQMRTMARRGIDFTFIEVQPDNTKAMAMIMQREYQSVRPADGLTRDFRRVVLAEAMDVETFGESVASAATSSLTASKSRSVYISSRNACRASPGGTNRLVEIKEEEEDSGYVEWVPPLEIPEIKVLDWGELDKLPAVPAVRHAYHFRQGEAVDWAQLDLAHTTQETTIKLSPTAFAKGAMRSAHAMFDMKMQKCFVAKCYYGRAAQDVHATAQTHLENDVQTQVVAKRLAIEFSLLPGVPGGVDFIVTSWYEVKNSSVSVSRPSMATFTAEPFIEGEYKKYNNNNGWASGDGKGTTDSLQEIAQAFSHFTWQKTYGQLMVVDLQGVGSIFTDPQIHSVERHAFGRGNLSEPGMAAFFYTHECNRLCKTLKLISFDSTNGPSGDGEGLPIHRTNDGDSEDKSMTCSCALCGAIVRVSHSKFVETHNQNGEIYCHECSKSVDYQISQPCIVCEKMLSFSPFWHDMKGMEHPTACAKCAFVVARITAERTPV